MIVQIAPRLVVLDPLRELHSGREDLSDEMAPIIRPLRQIAHETGVTIAL
jgi:RecA-family ATPase